MYPLRFIPNEKYFIDFYNSLTNGPNGKRFINKSRLIYWSVIRLNKVY